MTLELYETVLILRSIYVWSAMMSIIYFQMLNDLSADQ